MTRLARRARSAAPARARGIVLAAVALAATLAACAPVRPHQREALARRSMRSPFGDPSTITPYQAKVLESRTAGGLPGSTPGGGCGCSQ